MDAHTATVRRFEVRAQPRGSHEPCKPACAPGPGTDRHWGMCGWAQTFVAARGARSARRLAFQLWACRRVPERTALRMARRMPLRFAATLMSQCMMGWLAAARKRQRKTRFLVDSTTTHSITCRMVFDGSIDGRSWRDNRAFRRQLQVDIAQALSHLHGEGLGLLSSVSSLLKPLMGEHRASQITVGWVEIDDFSVEVTYSASRDPFAVCPDRLAEAMGDLIQSSSLRGQWTVFAVSHKEISRTFVGIPRADAKLMRKVLRELWNDAFASKGRQAAATRRLYYSSCLLLAGAFRALQQGVKQAKQQQASCRRVLGRIMRQQRAVAFDSFRSAASHSRHIKCVCQRIIKRMRSSFAASAFMRFQECVARERGARRRLAAAMSCWRSKNLQAAFLCWMGHMREQNEMRRVEKQLAEKRKLEGAHEEEQEQRAAVESRLRQHANKAIMRMIVKHQSRGFHVFLAAVGASKRARRILSRILRRDQTLAFNAYREAVHRSQELWLACRNLILRRHRSFMAAVLNDFASAVAAAHDERSRIARTIARWKTPELSGFFTRWVEFVDRQQEIHRQAQEEGKRQRLAGEQQQLRDQRSAIEARLQQRTRQTLLRIMKHHLATAFAGLLSAVKLSKRRRGKACQVLARLRRMRLARSFRTLLKTVQFEREVRKSREAEMETMDKNTQGQPVWFTHGSGIALGVKDRIQKQAQRTLHRAHLTFAFRSFRRCINASIEFVRQARKRMYLSRGMRTWRYSITSRRWLNVALLRLRRRRLHMYWTLWQTCPEDRETADISPIALDECMGQENAAQQTLEAHFVKTQERLHKQCRLMITKMLSAHLARAFAAFVEGFTCLKKQRQVCKRLLCRMKNVLVASVFDMWSEDIQIARVRNQKERVLLRRLQGSALGRAFDCWLQHVEVQRWQEEETRKSEATEDEDLESHKLARQALEEEFMKMHARMEQQSRRAMTRMITRRLAVAFETFVAGLRRSNEEHQIMLRAVCRIQNSQISAAFEALVAYANQARDTKCKMCRIVRQWRRSSLDLAIDAWLQYVQDQHAKQKRADLNTLHDASCDVVAMRDDEAAMMRETRVEKVFSAAAAAAARRVIQSCVGLAWDCWVEMAERAHHKKQEGIELLCLAIDGWRKFLHESRSTRWSVLVRLCLSFDLLSLMRCAKQIMLQSSFHESSKTLHHVIVIAALPRVS